MPKPVCVKCQRFFRPKKNGFPLIEGMPMSPNCPPGTELPDCWKPYKLWRADLWECEGCGTQIVVGFGQQPIAYHHEPGFKDTIRAHGATFQVNDC